MSEAVTFWYGCNVLRHGDIIHSCLDILRALGFEPSPVGGPDYCCGTVKDMNQTTAGGMAPGTGGRLNGGGGPGAAAGPPVRAERHAFSQEGPDRNLGLPLFAGLRRANWRDGRRV